MSLLGAVERLVQEALHAVIEPDRITVNGAVDTPPVGVLPRVTLAATECILERPHPPDRRPVQRTTVLTWPLLDGLTTFPLPKGSPPELSELLASTGHLLRAGDDYIVENSELRIRRPLPDGATALCAYLTGVPARGYSERTQAHVAAQVLVWSDTRTTLDPLSAQVAAALSLLASSNRCIRTEVTVESKRVDFILRDAHPRWHATRRRQLRIGKTPLLCDRNELELRGELETRVLLGPAPATETIRSVHLDPGEPSA